MTLITFIFLSIYSIYFFANSSVLLASLSGNFDGPAWENYRSRFVAVDNAVARVWASSVVFLLGGLLVLLYFKHIGSHNSAWLFLPEGVLLCVQGLLFGVSFSAYKAVQDFASRNPAAFLWLTLVPKILVLSGLYVICLT